jgi:hypothetical protein
MLLLRVPLVLVRMLRVLSRMRVGELLCLRRRLLLLLSLLLLLMYMLMSLLLLSLLLLLLMLLMLMLLGLLLLSLLLLGLLLLAMVLLRRGRGLLWRLMVALVALVLGGMRLMPL